MTSANGSTSSADTAHRREEVYLAGGCFWGMQDLLREIPGALETDVGYTGLLSTPANVMSRGCRRTEPAPVSGPGYAETWSPVSVNQSADSLTSTPTASSALR